MPRIIKFIISILLFGIIFEAGILSSYAIVTSKPPNIGDTIGMQINDLTAFLNSIHKSTPKTYNVTNSELVVPTLQNETGLDGINGSALSATITSKSGNNVNITLTATGYKDNQTTNGNNPNGNFTGGQIVITPAASYNLTATATATLDTNGVKVNVNTIQITAIKQIINQ